MIEMQRRASSINKVGRRWRAGISRRLARTSEAAIAPAATGRRNSIWPCCCRVPGKVAEPRTRARAVRIGVEGGRGAFELGELQAQEDKNEAQAWNWYQRAADAGEPHALARFGERVLDEAYAEADSAKKRKLMLESFRYYAAAAEVARLENFPDDAWRSWRYQRASLARLLARQGMMRPVAETFEQVRRKYAPAGVN